MPYGTLVALVTKLRLTKEKARKQTPALTRQSLNRKGRAIVDINRRMIH